MAANRVNHRVIVTGCAGFIGSHLAHHYLKNGCDVIGVDDVNDAYDSRLKQWRLEELNQRPGFTFQKADVADFEQLQACAETWLNRSAAQPPVMFHLAGRAGVRQSVEQPELYLRANVVGTLNVLQVCRNLGVRKMVLASTSSLYAGVTTVPFKEDDDTSRPLSPYAASKKAAEVLAYSFHHLHGIDVSVARFFTVYGPMGRPDMSVLQFCRGIATGKPITVYGDGTQERDFTYIDDIVAGLVAAAKHVGFEVFNLGNSALHSVNTLLEILSQELGKQPVIEYQPFQKADMKRTLACVAKAHQMLGWQPQVSLRDGLQKTVRWFRENQRRILELSF